MTTFDSQTGAIIVIEETQPILKRDLPTVHAGKRAVVLYRNPDDTLAVHIEGTFGVPVTATKWRSLARPTFHFVDEKRSGLTTRNAANVTIEP